MLYRTTHPVLCPATDDIGRSEAGHGPRNQLTRCSVTYLVTQHGSSPDSSIHTQTLTEVAKPCKFAEPARIASLLGGGTIELNTGKETIEWLFNEQLQVDDKWSVRMPNGFRWWADRNEQTVEVLGQETGPDGDIGYFVSVRTELLRSLQLGDHELKAINYFSWASPPWPDRFMIKN